MHPIELISSGEKYVGELNMLGYEKMVAVAQNMLLDSNSDIDAEHQLSPIEIAVYMFNPCIAEMTAAFASVISSTPIEKINKNLEDTFRHMLRFAKFFPGWSSHFLEHGEAELPGWFFRQHEIFIYHVLQGVVDILSLISTDTHISYLEDRINVVCRIAKGMAEVLPFWLDPHTKQASPALLLLRCCEAVDGSFLDLSAQHLTRGHVAFALLVVKDAEKNSDKCALKRNNTFGHLFSTGLPLAFIRRCRVWSSIHRDGDAEVQLRNLELSIQKAVQGLEVEASENRKRQKVEVINLLSSDEDQPQEPPEDARLNWSRKTPSAVFMSHFETLENKHGKYRRSLVNVQL